MPFKASFSFPTFKTLSAIFLTLAVCVLFVVLVSTVGGVEVQVKPSVSTRVVDSFFTLTTSETVHPGELHADFATTTLEVAAPIEGQSHVVKPAKARYKIVVHNQYSRNQSLVRTTRFLYNELLYRLVDPVTVQAGTSVSAVVEAEHEGVGYARSKGEKLTIPGLWEGVQPYIFGIVDEELRPGFVTIIQASQAQIDAAKQSVIQQLEQKRRDLIEGDRSVYVLHKERDSVVQAPEPGEVETDVVTGTQDMQYIVIAQNTLEGSIQESLIRIEPEKKFYYDHQDVQFEVLDWGESSARLRVTIPVRFYTPLTKETFDIAEFRGTSESGIMRVLNDTYGVTDAAVNYRPGWLKPLLSRFGSVSIVVLEP